MRFNMRRTFFAALIVVGMAGSSFGQRTSATFAGVVTDPTGAVLPGAEAQLVNEGTAAITQRVTTETGEFVFDYIPAGTYTLKIVLPGFRAYESRGIPLNAAQNVRRTYVLEVGAVTDSVTVTGEAPLVNTLSTEQRISIEALEVQALPTINRNITNILEVGSGLTKGYPTNDGMAGTRFRLNGLGGSSMSVTANGTDANGASGSPNISGYGGYNKIDVMSTEAIGEVQVVKGVMPAEYGQAMAGSMSVITKSGTNEWHGSLFHRYEGSVLTARSPMLSYEPNSVWNQFGGSLGGPIRKDSTFFFFAYEGYRQSTSTFLNPTVPTPYFRDILMKSFPVAATKMLLDLYPLPNQPHGPTDLLALWSGPGARINNDDHFDWKVDRLMFGGNLSLSFSGGHPYQSKASANPLDPQVFTTSSQRAALNYVKSWGRLTSSTRAGYNRNWLQRVDESWYLKDPDKGETVPGWRRIKNIGFPGLTPLRVENQTRGIIPSWQYEQQFAYFQGKHSWKFGVLLSLPSGGRPGTQSGTVNFLTLDDIVRNEPNSVSFEAGINPFRWRLVNFGGFLQDDWRVSRKLVLNLGLRYDRFGHYVPKPWHKNLPVVLGNFDGLLDPVNFVWGPLRPADNPFNSDNLSLGPRFGFAYTADSSGDLVVRGGFGVNFQSFDPQTYEVATGRTVTLPNSKTYTRAEAIARGLKYPVYNEDLASIIEAESGGKPQIGGRWNPNSKPPYAMNYTLGIQRALTSTLMLETAYVGTRGVKFNMARPYNQPDRITGLRPNPGDINGNYTDQSQQTVYNSWQTTLKQRQSHRLLYSVNYTWGKSMSYVGGDVSPSFLGDTRGGVEDFDAVKIERSPSTGDVTHQLIGNFVYQLPTPFGGSRVGKYVLGGWELAGIWRGRTGLPMRITQTGGRPDITNLKAAVNTDCCRYGNLQYLNVAAFQLVDVARASGRTIRRGHAGNAPVRGPGQTSLDLSVLKNFSIGERKSIELKGDILNAFNQTLYRDISTNMNSINFGQVTATDPSRTVQIQLRLSF
jgi:Carboxypeptidase regulatory-like domain/TonB-dependent Receptor Plug Domain